MKTLKRTLSLVLVLCMVVGVLAVSASAKFTDDADIKYEEAVGVLSGLGIIDGFDDGTFGPQKSITRAQIAKLIYCAITGQTGADAADDHKSLNKFKDVPASFWGAGFVNYIANKGIIIGHEGNFRPNDPVTGYEVILIVLRALGYDSVDGGKEITNAASWKDATITLASDLGLLKTIAASDKSYNAAASREVSCEIIYRAFMMKTVSYDKIYGRYTETIAGTATASKSLLEKNFDYTGLKTAGSVQVTSVAKGSDGTYTATAGSYSFKVADYTAVGHKYIIFYKGVNTVVYAMQTTYTAAYTGSNLAELQKTINVETTTSVAKSTNYAALGSAAAIEAGEVLIVEKAASGKDAVVAAVKVTAARGTATITYLYATTGANAKAAGYKVMFAGEEIFNTQTNVNKAPGAAAEFKWDTLVSASKLSATAYYNYTTVGADYILSAVATIEGQVTLKTAGSPDKVTIGGKSYGVAIESANVPAGGVADFAGIGFGATYKAMLSPDGQSIVYIAVVSGDVVNDIGDVAYASKFAVQKVAAPIFGQETYKFYVQMIDAEGKIEAYEITKINGKALAIGDPAAAAATGYVNVGLTESTAEGNLDTAFAGPIYANVTGSTVELFGVYTPGTLTHMPSTAAAAITEATGTTASDGATFNGISFGSTIYISSTTKFVYVDGGLTTPTAATVKTGAHKSNIGAVDYTAVSSNGIATIVFVEAKYGDPSGTVSTIGSYFVVKYNGQAGASLYSYDAYKVGSTEKETLVVDNASLALSTASNKLYVLGTKSDGTKTFSDGASVTAKTDVGAPVVLDGSYVIDGRLVAADHTFLNLTTTQTIGSVAALSGTADIIYVVGDAGTANAGKIIEIFVVGE